MKRIVVLSCAVVLALSAAAGAQAPTTAPKVLEILREEVKFGKGIAHEKNETAFAQAWKKAKVPAHFIALSSTSGAEEVWFVSGYDSYDARAKTGEAVDKTITSTPELTQLIEKDGEYVSSGRTWVATYRDDLSYRRAGVNVAQMRSVSVTTVHVRPGHIQEWEEARKIVNAAHEKANLDEHWAVFQVTQGAPAGTFLIFLPHKSAKELDDAPGIHGQTYQDALGDDGQRRLRELTSSAVVSSETNVMMFSPKMSFPADEWVKADPDFWAPKAKPTAAAKPTAGGAGTMKEGGKAPAPAPKAAKKAPGK